MDKKAAYDLVVEYLMKRFSVLPERITPEARIFDDLQLDSIDALDMLALFDRKYKIAVNEEQAQKLRTVQDVVDYIVTNIAEVREEA